MPKIMRNNVAYTGGSSSALSELTDVSISTPTNNQVLTYNSSTSKWENVSPSAGSPVTVTLLAADWNSSTHLITVNVTGVTATSFQDVVGLPATSSANISNNTALQAANIMDAGQAAGTLTFYAETVPTSDLQIRVIVRT